MSSLRTFVAVELDEELKGNLAHLQQSLRGRVAPRSVRWVRPEGIHLTLKFLGDTPVTKVDEVKAALTDAALEVEPFAFTVEGLGCFPNARRPRVLWVGLQEPSGALHRLREAVEAHVAPLGFPMERRSFHPHLTLGRVQRYASKSEVGEIGDMVSSSHIGLVDEMGVTAVSYIKSDLKPSGAVYTTLLAARLGESTP
jgi:2'-5' RNA ligase